MKTLKQIQEHYHIPSTGRDLFNTIIKEWLTQKRQTHPTNGKERTYENSYKITTRYIRNAFINELLEELNQ